MARGDSRATDATYAAPSGVHIELDKLPGVNAVQNPRTGEPALNVTVPHGLDRLEAELQAAREHLDKS